MRNDRCVLLIMFDLPNSAKKEAAAYRKFRKCLTDEAYIQVQESVYVRAFRHRAGILSELARIQGYLSECGNVLALPLNLNEFKKMKVMIGKTPDYSLLSDDFLFI